MKLSNHHFRNIMCLCKKDLRFEEPSDEEDPSLDVEDEGDAGNLLELRDAITQFLNWFLAEDGPVTEEEMENLCHHQLEAVRNDVVDFVTGQSNLERDEVVEEIRLVILSAMIQNHCWILS